MESGTIMSGSIRISWPRPSQAGQAPNGLLNENSLGSISGMVKPETGQANFEEKVTRRGLAVLLLLVGIFEDRDAVGEVERLLQRVGEPGAEIGPDHDAVDDDVDVVLELLVERRRVRDLVRTRH